MNRPRLDIHTLGGLMITLDGQPLMDLTARSARALLVYLAYQDKPVSRLGLAELLWPERPQAKALTNLRVTLHRISALFGDLLSIQREVVSLSPGAARLDAAELERMLEARQQAAAVELFQGDFLEGFYLDGSRAFEDWQADVRERLHCDVLSALQGLIQQAIGAGQTEAAIDYSQRLLGFEPLHEPAQRQLMRLLAQDGQRTAALANYARFREKIIAELGIEPEKTTMELAGQIKAGLIQPEPRRYPNIPAVELDHHSPALPLPSTPLIGRQVELEELTQLFANPDCRLLTVLGSGGIGKTRLALELAHRLGRSFLDGACFISLADITRPAQLVSALAAGLDLSLTSDSNLDDQLLRYLERKDLFLVLDNFEQLIEPNEARTEPDEVSSIEFLSALLNHTYRLKILVTSRQRLRLHGEWLYTLRGLSLDSPAVELFDISARRLKPDYRPEEDLMTVERICRLLGGSPLAIELAAAWIPVLPVRQIAENIQLNLDFLINRLADAPDRHRSIRALFEQSWQILDSEEKRLITRLAVFAGGGRLEEILAVCQVDPGLLLRLADKSLIQEISPGRFSLHELLRQYALEALHRADGDLGETAAQHRHFEAYLRLAEEADGHLRRAGQAAWLARLEPERENFQAALEWAMAGPEPDQAAHLVNSLGWYWRMRSHVVEARGWIEKILKLETISTPQQASLLFHLGGCNWAQGNFGESRVNSRRSLALWESLMEAGGLGWSNSMTMLGMSDYQLNQFGEARVDFEASLAAFRTLGDEWGCGFSLGWLGKTYTALGEDELAFAATEECLATFRQIGDRFGLALFLSNEAWRVFDSGQLAKARLLAAEATELRREIGHLHSLAEALSLQATIAEAGGERQAALDFYHQAQAIYDRLGNQAYINNLEQTIRRLEERTM